MHPGADRQNRIGIRVTRLYLLLGVAFALAAQSLTSHADGAEVVHFKSAAQPSITKDGENADASGAFHLGASEHAPGRRPLPRNCASSWVRRHTAHALPLVQGFQRRRLCNVDSGQLQPKKCHEPMHARRRPRSASESLAGCNRRACLSAGSALTSLPTK